jgi:hypothetical protein
VLTITSDGSNTDNLDSTYSTDHTINSLWLLPYHINIHGQIQKRERLTCSLGTKRQRDGYRACSNLSSWDNAQLHSFTQYELTHVQIQTFSYPWSENVGVQEWTASYIKFLVKLKKSATETFQLLTKAYSEECMSRASNISKTKRSTQELFKVQGHVDCFLQYPGYCNGRVGYQWPDVKSALLPWSLDKIMQTREKETTRIMEKRLDFAPTQWASPNCFVCEAVFS